MREHFPKRASPPSEMEIRSMGGFIASDPLSAAAVRDDEGNSCLHWAARHGREEDVVALLAAGADPKAANEIGWTPLIEAASEGHFGACRLLLSSGADPRQADLAGRGPLHLAALHGHNEVCLLMVEAGADPRARDKGGRSAVDLASSPARTAEREPRPERLSGIPDSSSLRR